MQNKEIIKITNKTLAQIHELAGKGFDSNTVYAKNLGFDAETIANVGIPGQFLAYYDPRPVKVLLSALRAERLGRKEKFGGLDLEEYIVTQVEHTGSVRTYSDFSEEPTAGLNTNYQNRQAHVFEEVLVYGHREMMLQKKNIINYIGLKRESVAISIARKHNEIWFKGVAGLRNYGMLNDPQLAVPQTPSGGETWDQKTPEAIAEDIRLLIAQLITNSGELVTKTTPMTLVMSGEIETVLYKPTQYAMVTCFEWLQKQFPNITFETAPEFLLDSGTNASKQMVRLYVREWYDRPVIELGFGELYFSHGTVYRVSSTAEKISASNFGAVIPYPVMIADMVGV